MADTGDTPLPFDEAVRGEWDDIDEDDIDEDDIDEDDIDEDYVDYDALDDGLDE